MSVSERIVQENMILRDIRLALSGIKCVATDEPRRRGAVYASSPITSGLLLYKVMREIGVSSPQELKAREPVEFSQRVMRPNLERGELFGKSLRSKGFRLVITPGIFFAKGWAQEHYMSLWRQVIRRYARATGFDEGWEYSNGCAEEFLINLEAGKTMLWQDASPIKDPGEAAKLIEAAVEKIDSWNFDAKPLYDLWRQIVLTIEARKK